jgi:serine/threonine protein kinase HipA of HipAB toxin-antitoxin module
MGRRRIPNAESFQRARDFMNHPLFPGLIREAVRRVEALHLQAPVSSIPSKREAPPRSRSDEQNAKRRADITQRMSILREE